MSQRKLKVLIIDEDKNTTVAEMDTWLFQRLNIQRENIKTHKSISALNKTVAEFMKIFGNN